MYMLTVKPNDPLEAGGRVYHVDPLVGSHFINLLVAIAWSNGYQPGDGYWTATLYRDDWGGNLHTSVSVPKDVLSDIFQHVPSVTAD